MEEHQVYRITPENNKFYVTAEYTKKIGRFPNETYYTTLLPRYVGKYSKEISTGYGDGKQTTYYFYNDLSNSIKQVHLAYEGTTSFIEVESFKIVMNRYRILSLAKMMLSNSEPCINLQDQTNILSIINQYLNKIYSASKNHV